MAVKKQKTDPAHEETERLLAEMEKKISKEYAQAEKELQAKIDDYFRRFALKDQKWQEWVRDGVKTKQEYQQWRIGQMAVGKRWESMKDTIAEDFVNADKIARSIVNGYMPEVYAENFNYGTYEAEVGSGVDTSFTLYSRESVENIVRGNSSLLPAPGRKVSREISEGRAKKWNEQLVQSVMIQGILQGESIPKLATRLAKAVGDSDRKAAIRNARTMATGAQNAGRVDAYKRAEDKGVKMEQMWRATLDMRTRHEHRLLDGQRQKVGEPFEVEGEKIMYPGDPSAPGHLIYNCRCTLRGVVAGLEPQAIKYRDTSAIEGMTYEEWKASKIEKPNPITLPEEKGEAIAEKYRIEYGKTGNFGARDMMYSSKNVEYDSKADFTIHIDNYSDQLNAGLSKAAEKVARIGGGKRYEYSALVDTVNGEIVDFGTDEEKSSVGYYHDYLRKHLDGHFILVHNHNTESTLSLPDIQELASWKNLDGYCAVSNNGIISFVKSNGEKTTEYLWLKYEDDVKRLKNDGWNGIQLEQEIVKIAVEEFGAGGMLIHDGRTK